MLAPSPDWFVGVSGFDMRAGGEWIASAHIDLYPWDAGTDNGTTFSSANLPADPRQPIELLDTFPFAGTGPVASYDFELVASYETPPGDFDLDGDVDGRDFLVWQRNTNVGDLADWHANYGAGGFTASEVASPVPEPNTIAILLAAGLMGCYRQTRGIN